MTPPLEPSPPIAVRTLCMPSTTLASPTGVRKTRRPWRLATASITDDVVRLTTMSPSTFSRAASATKASTSSLSMTWPVSSHTARRSPSGSWPKPISQRSRRTSAASSVRVSGRGSASRGKTCVGSTEMACRSQPRTSRKKWTDISEPAPLTPSRATRKRRSRIVATSMCFRTRSKCSAMGRPKWTCTPRISSLVAW